MKLLLLASLFRPLRTHQTIVWAASNPGNRCGATSFTGTPSGHTQATDILDSELLDLLIGQKVRNIS